MTITTSPTLNTLASGLESIAPTPAARATILARIAEIREGLSRPLR